MPRIANFFPSLVYKVLGIFSLFLLFIFLINSLYSFFADWKKLSPIEIKCRDNLVALMETDDKQEFENLTTKKFQKEYTVFDFKERTDISSNLKQIKETEFIGKLPIDMTVFVCPSQGDNKFPFGCNGIGYTMKLNLLNGSCLLDEIGQYFD